MCESVGMADLLSDHFDSKHSRELIYMPLTGHPSINLFTFAFRSSKDRQHPWSLLLDLNLYGGTDPLGMFSLFSENG